MAARLTQESADEVVRALQAQKASAAKTEQPSVENQEEIVENKQQTPQRPYDVIEVTGVLGTVAGEYEARLTLNIDRSEYGPDLSQAIRTIIELVGLRPMPGQLVAASSTQKTASCPVHGADNLRPAFNGKGKECSAFAPEKKEWTKDRPAVMKSGEVRWYCKYRTEE